MGAAFGKTRNDMKTDYVESNGGQRGIEEKRVE
jgi:hypothetical protein